MLVLNLVLVKKIEVNLQLKTTAVLRKKCSSRVHIQLQEKLQHLVDIHFDFAAPVITDGMRKSITFIYLRVSFLQKNYWK